MSSDTEVVTELPPPPPQEARSIVANSTLNLIDCLNIVLILAIETKYYFAYKFIILVCSIKNDIAYTIKHNNKRRSKMLTTDVKQYEVYVKANGIPQYVIVQASCPTTARNQAVALYGNTNVIGVVGQKQ